MNERKAFLPDLKRAHVEGEEEDDAPKPLSAKDAALAKAREGYADFGKRHEGTINAYYGTPDIKFTCKPGGWYIDVEDCEVNADPTFFLEMGFSEPESLFATFHEAGHFDDMVENHKEYLALFARIKKRADVHKAYPKALQRLYNCVEDVLENNKVEKRWKAGQKVRKPLYRKLFPESDLASQPKHRQFMYALLREAMLPEELCKLDPVVREKIEEWQKRGGKAKALDIMTAAAPDGKARKSVQERFSTYRHTLEPIFEALYKDDLENWEPPEKQEGGEGEKGEGEPGEPGEGDPFGADPNKDAIPDPIDFDDLADQVKKLNDKIAQKKKNKFKELMGVEKKDFEDYQKDVRQVAPYIEAMSRVFDDVIQRRKTYRRILNKPVKEGAILNPPRIATGIAELKGGNTEPEIFLDFKTKEVVRNRPDKFEFELVCDGSGSMGNQNDSKAKMQRLLATLVGEGLNNFRERIACERARGEKINLDIKTGVRVFSDDDQAVKPLSADLTHEDRVRMRKALWALPGGGNNEPATFTAIEQAQFGKETITALQKGDLKKVILFLSDGQTDAVKIQEHINKLISLVGPKGEKNLVIACIGFGDGVEAKTTYAPNGYFVEKLEQLPDTFMDFLAKILEDV